MSRYIPNTPEQVKDMLSSIGVKSIEDLFASIPENVRLNRKMNIPEGITEMELWKHMNRLSDKNKDTDDLVCFLGAGAYDHYIPSTVSHLVSRQEFYTAYTPYQPEISQGILQAVFEYQTMICALTGMSVSNASMYDGASALAEACAISHASFRNRNKILLAKSIHPEAKEVVKTYLKYKEAQIIEMDYDKKGRVDLEKLYELCDENTAAVCIQTPNFFGLIEEMKEISQIVKQKGAMFIAHCDPISLSILEPPGSFGADFVTGEGQSLGNPLAYGGPYLGFIAASEQHMRKMPGRIAGQTVDVDGKRGFVLTLQAREQHIRREKATSNICSNQALCALAATVYMSMAGKEGLKEIAARCLNNANYTYKKLLKTGQFEEVFKAPFFKEFIVKSKKDPEVLNMKLLSEGFLGGYPVYRNYKELENGWLIAVTEKRTKKEIDDFVMKAGENL